MSDPRSNAGPSLTARLLAMEQRIAQLEAGTATGLLGTDQTIKGCHDRLDNLLGAGNASSSNGASQAMMLDASVNAAWSGQLILSERCVRAVFVQTVEDSVAATVFRITLADATNDGGAFSCVVHALVQHRGEAAAGNAAAKSFVACFARGMRDTGAGTNSAVSEIVESASGATTPATSDIGTVTMTVVETSEFLIDVQFTVDLTGTSVGSGYVTAAVELVWNRYTTAPVLSQP